MKGVLLLLIAVALVMTAQKREGAFSSPIGPTDELIDRALLQDEQTQIPPHE